MGKKIIFGIIIVFGIFFRLYQLNSLPGGLFLDEINMAVDAKNLAEHGTDQYGRPFPFYFEDATDFKLPGYIYTATFSVKTFGDTIFAMHLPAALAGILAIFLIGYLATLLFPDKKYIGYFAATTIALSPMAIHFSRISYETCMSFSFHLIYLISLLHVLRNNHPKRWLLIGCAAILIADFTYPSPRFVIPVFTTLLLLICLIMKSLGIKRRNIFQAMTFLLVVSITYIPTIIFPFADARQLNLVSVDSFSGHTLLGSLFLKAQSVVASLIREWNAEFLFDKGDTFAYRHGTKEVGVFLLIAIIPFILGIMWGIRNVSRKYFSLVFLFLFAFVAGLPSALSSEFPYGTRILIMLVPYTLFIALGLDVLVGFMQKQKPFLRIMLSSLFIIILTFQLALFTYIYFVDFAHSSLPEFPTAPVKIAAYIKNFHQENPQSQIYFMAQRSCRTWSNDALYLWYYDNLPNTPMIAWNNAYRIARYAATHTSPFEAYDKVTIPPAFIPSYNLHLYNDYATQAQAPKGSLFVRCGDTLATYNKKTEQLVTVFYMDDTTRQDPYYVVTIKK